MKGKIMGVLHRLLNQDSFAEAFEKLQENHKKLAVEYETQKAVNKKLAAEYVELEARCKLLATDPEQFVEMEIERRTIEIEEEYAEKMSHKWYGIGRQDAYAEMGIKNIEAHERGNVLAQLPNGDVVEIITGLEDVKPEDGVLSDDEIIIDDLEGV